MYKYPSLQIYRILREGTEAAYSNLDFSPSGEKLASVGSYPDYMMTIWDWKKVLVYLYFVLPKKNNVKNNMILIKKKGFDVQFLT